MAGSPEDKSAGPAVAEPVPPGRLNLTAAPRESPLQRRKAPWLSKTRLGKCSGSHCRVSPKKVGSGPPGGIVRRIGEAERQHGQAQHEQAQKGRFTAVRRFSAAAVRRRVSLATSSVWQRPAGQDARRDSEEELVLRPQSYEAADLRVGEATHMLELADKQDLRRLLLPFGRFRTAWDLLVLILVGYTAITLPIFLSYPVNVPDGLQSLELAMDVVFLIDIALNFRTAVVRDAELVTDRHEIARTYFARWFWVDAIGSLPWEIIFRIVKLANSSSGGVGLETNVLTLFKVLKVPTAPT